MNKAMFKIFKDKLESRKKKIRKYLNNKKNLKEKEKKFLKLLIKETRQLKKTLKEDELSLIICPHCQKSFSQVE